jgi:hypothetical protein
VADVANALSEGAAAEFRDWVEGIIPEPVAVDTGGRSGFMTNAVGYEDLTYKNRTYEDYIYVFKFSTPFPNECINIRISSLTLDYLNEDWNCNYTKFDTPHIIEKNKDGFKVWFDFSGSGGNVEDQYSIQGPRLAKSFFYEAWGN